MKLRVLGSHGSEHQIEREGESRHLCSCGLLINEQFLIDAGTITSQLLAAEVTQIRSIFLSHLHFDHIKGLPALADNRAGDGSLPIEICSIPEVLHGLEVHIFINIIYPLFFAIPNPHDPIFSRRPVRPNELIRFGALEMTPIAVNHLGPAIGFLISDGNSTILYSGDTFSNSEIWEAASRVPSLKAAFIECSFPDEMFGLAETSKHLTPKLFRKEVSKLGRPDIAVFAYHVKPRFRDRINSQLDQLRIPSLSNLDEGQELVF